MYLFYLFSNSNYKVIDHSVGDYGKNISGHLSKLISVYVDHMDPYQSNRIQTHTHIPQSSVR